jgi:hypothetical protein
MLARTFSKIKPWVSRFVNKRNKHPLPQRKFSYFFGFCKKKKRKKIFLQKNLAKRKIFFYISLRNATHDLLTGMSIIRIRLGFALPVVDGDLGDAL